MMEGSFLLSSFFSTQRVRLLLKAKVKYLVVRDSTASVRNADNEVLAKRDRSILFYRHITITSIIDLRKGPLSTSPANSSPENLKQEQWNQEARMTLIFIITIKIIITLIIVFIHITWEFEAKTMETGGKEDPLKLGLLSIVARAAFFNTLKTRCIPFTQAQCVSFFSDISSCSFVLGGCSFQRTPLAVCSPRASQCKGNWRACVLRSWGL